ncbi:MAG: S41 family peptidase [Ruminococcus sp.]|nr:S41 family peptidase [Ruminococcus sp.]MBQ3855844.1 S41 family peptidase [Ruminococcus sp.]HOO05477.1 S41 family peptidase [Ruminococcus sp.]HOR22180.1 S41 family peptidase [Ruminococcus sp.]
MNKKISLGLALSLIAISVAVTFILTSFFSLQSFNSKVVDVNEKSKKYSSLQLMDTYVRDNFYGEINEGDLSDGILKGYISGLDDQYSRYLTADEYLSEQSDDSGELVGLGLTLAQDESGYIRISEILTDSPAAETGLVQGDLIIRIDGLDVIDTGFEESVEAMRGTEGSSITLTIRRDGIDTDYTFTRRAINVVSVTGEMLGGYIGYIKITGFKKNTPEQFIETLERLTTNGAKYLLFDVRDNPGGLVSALEECLDPLLPEGVVATAEYKDGHSETIAYSDASELDLPMAVLVNEKTASAAELFAGALKDFGKASIVGMQTFGKGVMQATTPFEGGGAIVLTVAEYKTPFSPCYNGVGITPDYRVENEEADIDAQYSKAIEVLKMGM